MAIIERIPKPEKPELIDKVISEVQIGLAKNLPWLNYAFGRAQRLVKEIKGKKYFTPNVYAGGNEYLGLAPDSTIGNFSFFQIDEPQIMDWQPKIRGAIKTPFSIIFWFDMRLVRPNDLYRNTESVKAEILKILNGGFMMRFGRIEINRIYEQAENIYKGYTIEEVKNQYLMHPYAGFRFEGILIINEDC